MINIRHSPRPYNELELEGSNSELCELRAAIFDFSESDESAFDFPVESDFDPKPYERTLSRLRFSKTSDLLLVTVKDKTLDISGKPKFLTLFAKNLPRDAHRIPYHVHFGHIGREDCISEVSLDIVLQLRL